jgi:N-acetylglucosamine-6-phosphate deacetylase
MEWMTIHNARIITPQRILEGGAVQIEGGEIAAVLAEGVGPGDGQSLDARGMYLAPGFVEMHVHGGDGADFMDGTPEALETIIAFYGTRGVTSIQGTTTAAPLEQVVPVLEVAREWQRIDRRVGPRLVGIQLEGPFLNREQCGAQPPSHIYAPPMGIADRVLDYADVVTQITLAPELPGALDLIREVARAGILVAAGHSQATEPEVLAAIEAGLRHVIHIYSSMSTVIRQGPWRVPGLLECALVYDELTTEMIGDLCHLPPTLMRLVLRCKAPDKLCLVSDAMRGAGRPEGDRFLMGGQEVIIEDGVAQLPDRTSFAGSVTPLDAMVRNVVLELGVPLEQTIRLVTLNPARILGIEDWTGSIEVGKKADLVLLDECLQVAATLVEGQVVYRATSKG